MKLTEALSGRRAAGARRSDGCHWALVHRSRSGYHLTRYTPVVPGQQQSASWIFPNLYDLLVFARAQGFEEVDAEADDWQSAFETPTG